MIVLVLGGGGFIGSAMAIRLKEQGHWVRTVDLKHNEFRDLSTIVDEEIIGDLRYATTVHNVLTPDIDMVYQFAADMGGAGFVFTGEHDADIMHNSALVNLNIARRAVEVGTKKLFYSSSACMYPEHNQIDPDNPNCSEDSAYPAAPDSEYGWEKLFSERLYLAFRRNYNLDVKIARFHNIFGPYGTYDGGREKAPAAFCRKVANLKPGDSMEMWGDGKQTRSFLYIEDCLDAVQLLVDHPSFYGPVNIGSEEMVTINRLAEMTMEIADIHTPINHIEGPEGVRGRSSDNRMINRYLGWSPKFNLAKGLKITYDWISQQIDVNK